MARAYLPLPCKCALEVWETSGARTKDRLNELVEHYVKAYAMTEMLPDLQKQTQDCVPIWQWADA
ncbi:MAG: hypothetical protein JWP59_3753 [Massilia sp.]|nr:hypothetical protein [Massilia sp.]